MQGTNWTPADHQNIIEVVKWGDEVKRLVEELGRDLTLEELTDQITRINRRLDTTAGIVAGDGNYYARNGFPQQD